MYYWTDGRRYDGWWARGKQHGIGTYIDTQKQSQKFGLWEGGKRVKWFTEEEKDLINSGKFDVAQFFTEPEKAKEGLKSDATFKKPRDFDSNMNAMKQVLNITFN